jgi:hypothetical protein
MAAPLGWPFFISKNGRQHGKAHCDGWADNAHAKMDIAFCMAVLFRPIFVLHVLQYRNMRHFNFWSLTHGRQKFVE